MSDEKNSKLEPNWDKDFKDLNEICEKMATKPFSLNEKREQEYEFMNEFNEEMEDIDDFENFEQFLKNFKNKSKSENGKTSLEIAENTKDFLEKNALLKRKPLHKKSKTVTELFPGPCEKNNRKFPRNLKNFAIDDTFL